MATKSEIIDAIAAVGLLVSGIKVVYGPGKGTTANVHELPDNIAEGAFPAFVLVDGDSPIIPGSWERQTWTLEGSLWASGETPRGERYRDLLDLTEPLHAAFRGFGERYGKVADPAVQSVLVTEFRQIEGRTWIRPQQGVSTPVYLVMPLAIEVKVNRSVQYGH